MRRCAGFTREAGLRFLMPSLLALSLLPTPPALCQAPVVVDWRTKLLGTHPATVDRNTAVEIRVEHVNDIHFTYSIALTGTPREHFDAREISGLRSASSEAPCSVALEEAKKTVATLQSHAEAFLGLPLTIDPKKCADKPCDVTLEEARQYWQRMVSGGQPISVAADLEAADTALAHVCPADQSQAATLIKRVQAVKAIDDKLRSDEHTVRKLDVLLPDQDYVLVITQLYEGKPTQSGTATLELKPANNRLTLSAGVLFSQVQKRAYSFVTSPTDDGTQNVLSVAGLSSYTPTAATLLNYQLPKLGSDDVGLAFSSGPVVGLSGNSDASTFGWFVGISVHLFHRVWLTPGAHIGEFADFPPGFTHAGQPVPAELAAPSPVKRWTWRFGLSLTYKAADFGGSGVQGKVKESDKSSKQTP